MNNKNKIALIDTNFGNYNEYFHLWLKSCSLNKNIDWIFFTDNTANITFPENFKVFKVEFEELRNRIENFLGFTVSMRIPYKIPNFRVAFGEIFQEELEEYDFWGYCDHDVLWGNLMNFIPQEVLDGYKKIGWRGHFTIFKNEPDINSLYRRFLYNNVDYKQAFNLMRTNFWDEIAINNIFDQAGIPYYKDINFANLNPRKLSFSLTLRGQDEKLKSKYNIFKWSNGKLYRLYIVENIIIQEEFSYIHFLKRPMSVTELTFDDEFYIVPNKFINISAIDLLTIKRISKKGIYWERYKKMLTIKSIKMRILYYLGKNEIK